MLRKALLGLLMIVAPLILVITVAVMFMLRSLDEEFSWAGVGTTPVAVTGMTRTLQPPDPSWLSSPVAGAENDLVFALGNAVYALDATTGEERWHVATGRAGMPVVAGGAVYVGDDSGILHAIDADNGQVGWRFVLAGGRGLGAPAVADGLVFIATAGAPDSLLRSFAKPGTVFALDAVTGEERWRFTAHRMIGGSPAATSGMVFITASEDGLYALDAKTGEQRWFYPAANGITQPVVLNNRVFVVGQGPTPFSTTSLMAFDATTGDQLWSIPTGNADIAPSVADDTVYVATGRMGTAHPYAGLLALEAATGRERWYYVTDGKVQIPAVAAGSIVAVSSGVCREPVYDWFTACMQGWVAGVDGLDLTTGDYLWRFRLDEPGATPPQSAGDLIYVDDGQGTLWALDGASGEERWHFPT